MRFTLGLVTAGVTVHTLALAGGVGPTIQLARPGAALATDGSTSITSPDGGEYAHGAVLVVAKYTSLPVHAAFLDMEAREYAPDGAPGDSGAWNAHDASFASGALTIPTAPDVLLKMAR